MHQFLRGGETSHRKLPWIDEAPAERGFGNALLAGVAGGQVTGSFGAAVALDQLQATGGLAPAARLLSSNARVQAAMAAQVDKPAGLWSAVMGAPLPARLQDLLGGDPSGLAHDDRALVEALLQDAEDAGFWLHPSASPAAAEPRDPRGTEGEITYSSADVEDAYNFRFSPDPDELVVQAEARVLAGPERPLRTADRAMPEESRLYALREPQGGGDGWQAISCIVGSPERPEVFEHVVPDTLFIGGAPALADVQQGALGTCWLLATLLDLVVRDPDRIRDAFLSTGPVVRVRLFRPEGPDWVPVVLSVPNTLARKGGGSPLGAQPRIAEEPSWCDWFAQPMADLLLLRQRPWYEMALWAPLLEKALVLYSERYGDPSEASARESGASGYDLTDGGNLLEAAHILTGASDLCVQAKGSTNLKAVLTWLSELQVPTEERSLLVGASVGDDLALDRLHSRIQADLPRLAAFPDVEESLRELDRLLVLRFVVHFRVVPRAARAALTSLRDFGLDQDFAPLAEQLDLVADRASRDEAGLVIRHQYAILGAKLVDAKGEPLVFQGADRGEELARVDLRLSTVTLRNPWGRREPDFQQGEGPDDGQFELSVAQLLRLLPEVDAFALPAREP